LVKYKKEKGNDGARAIKNTRAARPRTCGFHPERKVLFLEKKKKKKKKKKENEKKEGTILFFNIVHRFKPPAKIYGDEKSKCEMRFRSEEKSATT